MSFNPSRLFQYPGSSRALLDDDSSTDWLNYQDHFNFLASGQSDLAQWSSSVSASTQAASSRSQVTGASEHAGEVSNSDFITTGAIAPDVISLAGSNIVFHNTYGAGVTTAYHQAVLDAEHFIEGHLTAGTTVNLFASFDFQSLGPNFSGQNNFFLYTETYAAWRAQVAARATSADDAAAVAALPTTDPTGGLGVSLPSGYARMMGMTVPDDVDAIVLNSDLTFNFTNGDATGVLEHELTEGAMGRVSALGFRAFNNGTHFWNPMDFYRFNANGVRDFTGGQDGVSTFFGFDATHVFTNFQYHNSINAQGQYDGFDLADWDHTVGDSFGPGGPGSPGIVSDTDLRVMDVLGWGPIVTDDFAGSIATTGVVAVGGSVTGNIETNGDHDWFRVSLVAGHRYAIEEMGSPSGHGTLTDPLVQIHNSVGTALGSNDDGGFGLESELAVFDANTTGTYYIDAGAFSTNTGTYTIQVQDLGTSANRFSAAHLGVQSFGTGAGGWDSQHHFPRAVGHINNDDVSDIVGFGSAGVIISTGTGLGNFSSPILTLNAFGAAASAGGWDSQDHFPRMVGDINGNGFDDIVGFGNAGVFVAFDNNGNGFGTPFLGMNAFGASPAAGGWSSQDAYPRAVADVNGDGTADIVGFGSSGVFVSLGTFGAPMLGINAFGAGQAAGGWASQNQFPRELADVNGDHRADIVGFGSAGAFVSLSNGNGTFAAPILGINAFGTSQASGGWDSFDHFPRLLADVNADGRADIVAFGSSATFVALGQADGHFGTPTTASDAFGASPSAGGWSSFDLFPRLLADVTGDQRADILGFGANGVFVSPSHDLLTV
jgi:hypothetical protein